MAENSLVIRQLLLTRHNFKIYYFFKCMALLSTRLQMSSFSRGFLVEPILQTLRKVVSCEVDSRKLPPEIGAWIRLCSRAQSPKL